MSATVRLDVLSVKNPCTEPWAEMRGDAKTRFCGLCEKHVHNLSAMTRAEATALLEEKQESGLCVRFYRRKDGTVSTVDCAPIRFAKARQIARRTMSGAAAVFVSLLGLVFGLGLFRMSGIDVSSWLEDTAVERLAKAGKKVFAPGSYEEPEDPYDGEDFVMGTEVYQDPAFDPPSHP